LRNQFGYLQQRLARLCTCDELAGLNGKRPLLALALLALSWSLRLRLHRERVHQHECGGNRGHQPTLRPSPVWAFTGMPWHRSVLRLNQAGPMVTPTGFIRCGMQPYGPQPLEIQEVIVITPWASGFCREQ
jgi:hypothetical protein